jgi:NADPH:quinone reductase-like Zn-dependent oxidoreductase
VSTTSAGPGTPVIADEAAGRLAAWMDGGGLGAGAPGFQLRGFASNEPDEARRNEPELRELLGQGRAFPHIGATFTLAAAAAALRHVADGKAIGKVALDIGSAATRIMDACQTL